MELSHYSFYLLLRCFQTPQQATMKCWHCMFFSANNFKVWWKRLERLQLLGCLRNNDVFMMCRCCAWGPVTGWENREEHLVRARKQRIGLLWTSQDSNSGLPIQSPCLFGPFHHSGLPPASFTETSSYHRVRNSDRKHIYLSETFLCLQGHTTPAFDSPHLVCAYPTVTNQNLKEALLCYCCTRRKMIALLSVSYKS